MAAKMYGPDDRCSHCQKRVPYARGLCQACYQRDRKNGSPVPRRAAREHLPVPKLDRVYAAGFFEGEGSIRINTPTGRNAGALLCDVANTVESAVAFFADRWGGSVRYEPSAPPRNPYWRWRCAARQAAVFLRDVEPYLRTEKYRERCALALEFQDQKNTLVRRDPASLAAHLAVQQDYYERMRALNVRGRLAA